MFAEAQRPAREGGRELPDWLSSCARLSSPTHTCILTPLPSLGRTYFVLILSRSFEEGGWVVGEKNERALVAGVAVLVAVGTDLDCSCVLTLGSCL